MKRPDYYEATGWGLPNYDGYLEFHHFDQSGISVSNWNHMRPVLPHKHYYYEFAIVSKGCCLHTYKGLTTSLLPGDVFFIAPGEEHSYEIEAPVELTNVQFYSQGMNDPYKDVISLIGKRPEIPADAEHIVGEWDTILQMLTPKKDIDYPSYQNDLVKQGVLHLDVHERKEVNNILKNLMDEQMEQNEEVESVKSMCLLMMLIRFKRILSRSRGGKMETLSDDSKETRVFEILSYLDEHITDDVDVKSLASRVFLSEGYFRNIFKNITGLSPVEYINRLRIMKSLDFLQEDFSVAEAAEKVGIYDPSYYSRLFKKYMGYSPRNFKIS